MALPPRALAPAALAAALALLDASLSFHNVWPTPAIAWRGELSVELAGLLLILAVLRRGADRPPVRAPLLRLLAALWLLLVIGHYADVTTPALYGRDINLYWDIRYMPDVVAMITTAVPVWVTMAVVAAAAIVIAALYAIFRWALGRVLVAMDDRRVRTVAVVASALSQSQ